MRRQFFDNAKRLVIKIGTSVIAAERELDRAVVQALARDVSGILGGNPDLRIVLVTSGAIAAGMKILGISKRPREIEKLQALAAVGQRHLMQVYDAAFNAHGIVTSQILLTWDDLGNAKRYANTRRTLEELFKYRALPVINENDTVATEEIQFGDNDQLSAMAAMLIEADLLIILSDSNGLYADYKAGQSSRIPMVDDLSASVLDSVKDSKKEYSKGGMSSKLAAVGKAVGAGIPCILADGGEDRVLSRLFDGEDLGTIFLPKMRKVPSKKNWIAYVSKPEGTLVVDEGAEAAMLKKGKSLLSKGIVRITGHFKPGDPVAVMSRSNKMLGKGIVNFSSSELEKIKGLDSDRWSKILGRACMDEVMHRDNFGALQ